MTTCAGQCLISILPRKPAVSRHLDDQPSKLEPVTIGNRHFNKFKGNGTDKAWCWICLSRQKITWSNLVHNQCGDDHYWFTALPRVWTCKGMEQMDCWNEFNCNNLESIWRVIEWQAKYFEYLTIFQSLSSWNAPKSGELITVFDSQLSLNWGWSREINNKCQISR
jgi:hypothetical protein